MNWNILLTLLKGSNTYATIVKVLQLAAGFLAGRDTDHTGTDDLLAGCLLSISDGISAYAIKDNNQHGNIVDGLQKYRKKMFQVGVIAIK